MSNTLKKFVKTNISLLTILLISLNIGFSTANVSSNPYENIVTETLLSYIPHSPISINSDDDFGVFPGNGTLENPYLIEGYHIDSSSNLACIRIEDTTKVFVIRDCLLEGGMIGISLNNVGNDTATIENNVLAANDNGISITYTNNCSIFGNTITEGMGQAIWMQSSHGFVIAENNCTNYNGGLSFYYCDNFTIINNNFSENYDGIEIIGTYYTHIENNICLNSNFRGIALYGARNTTLINNECKGNVHGIYLLNTQKCIFLDNFCSNNDNNGIYLENSHSNSFISNTISSQSVGIFLEGADFNIFSSNIISENSNGILMEDSSTNSIALNNFFTNSIGIYLKGSFYCIINENEFRLNSGGGVVFNSLSTENIVFMNIFEDNGGKSQGLDDGFYNSWYKEDIQLGNFWSDWLGIGSYSIYFRYSSGINAEDIYPSEYPMNNPVITNITHTPYSPTEEDLITIRALITDSSGIEKATLFYRVNDSSWLEVLMTRKLNSVFEAIIGPFNAGMNIDYYLTAKDNSAFVIVSINDNSSSYYSFTILESTNKMNTSLMLPLIFTSVILFILVIRNRGTVKVYKNRK